MLRAPPSVLWQVKKSIPDVPKPRSAISEATTSWPCAARTVAIAPSPQQGSQTGPRNRTCCSSASVTQLGVA